MVVILGLTALDFGAGLYLAGYFPMNGGASGSQKLTLEVILVSPKKETAVGPTLDKTASDGARVLIPLPAGATD